ncbi:MAG: aromatic hydrocarbon degradation protein [Deltaproteobacteria bacterium]|nr:aromatic hydrocarbon degradation protein [Deltaproteobacteria bacterium]
MRKKIAVISLTALLAAGSAYASGYRIPEQSVNSVARAGAYIAHTPEADAAYYNPANMSWLADRGYLETDLTYLHLTSISYRDNRSPLYNGDSSSENFLLPTFFAVSPRYNKFRLGLSFTLPAGLSKEWSQPYPKTFAQEFTLKVYEFDGSVAYKFNDYISFAAGLRGIHSSAKVASSGTIATGVKASRYMEGDTNEFGYNLAATVRPLANMNLSMTYRSKVDLDLDGNAVLATSAAVPGTPSTYNGAGAVTIPLPAILAIAGSYTFADRLTVELEYDRTYWSDYKQLDFRYPVALTNPYLAGAFDAAIPKKWEDSNAWRIGVQYDMKNGFILMAGFALDKTPIPDSTILFDLPGSDARIYSMGLRYAVNNKIEVGAAYLYDTKDKRNVANAKVSGTFDNSAAHLFTVGLNYKL